ncbi:hypothetical protein DFJ74DRAFT_762677 [Hyaloraphidium curvatum]|nr:hypothetical protein DFJ74DRAFT_762677 [Hyaloraphidium curvatum]
MGEAARHGPAGARPADPGRDQITAAHRQRGSDSLDPHDGVQPGCGDGQRRRPAIATTRPPEGREDPRTRLHRVPMVVERIRKARRPVCKPFVGDSGTLGDDVVRTPAAPRPPRQGKRPHSPPPSDSLHHLLAVQQIHNRHAEQRTARSAHEAAVPPRARRAGARARHLPLRAPHRRAGCLAERTLGLGMGQGPAVVGRRVVPGREEVTHGGCSSSSAWGGVGCCCRRPTTVRVTKYKTKTAVKTVKRTRTLTRTVTTTTLVRRRLEARQDDEEPEEAVDPAEEILETPTEEPLPPAPADEEPAVAPLGLDEAPVEQSPVDAEERRLFARNYCQACPRGVAPRPSGSGERCCVTKVTSTTTRTKTTTRIKTTTVKTATKTITVTASQSAAVRIPVQVKTQNGTPVGNALVQLVGPPIGRLGKRDIWAFCYTHPTTGICNLLYPTPLTPNSNYAILTPGAPDIPIPTDASGQPPPPPSGGVYPIVVPESSARLGARELIARKGADGRYRRALKARATPAPVVF